MRYGFGVDIYGAQVKLGFFDETGKLLDKWKITPPMMSDGNQILPAVAEEIEQYIAKRQLFEDDIIGVGVGIPGPVNSSGTVNKCVNFGWGIFNIDRALSGLTGLHVKSGNVANLSAMGECWKGSGASNMVFLAMNTGLGGAVVCDGKVVHGAHGGGGELGHMIVNKEEKVACTCGKRGCVEQYCSPKGILRVAKRQLASSNSPSVLRKRPPGSYQDVVLAASSGDLVAVQIMNQVYDYAGQALANVCCVTNPSTVVLGGEFCRIGRPAMEGISKYFKKYVFHANANVYFKLAELGTDACLFGAFKLVLDEFGV